MFSHTRRLRKVNLFESTEDGTQSRFDINDLAYCGPREDGAGLEKSGTMAEAALRGDAVVLDSLAASLLVPRRNNFVERPWGGTSIRAYKRYHPLPDQPRTTGLGLGEAFEIAAFDDDEESREHPSLIECDDGSNLSLPQLLREQGGTFLGRSFVARHGACFPLLPKTLDVRELLSVQGHPPGHTEVYIIIDAAPGATLRLGFNEDIDALGIERELLEGLARQQALVEMLEGSREGLECQRAIGPWLADRSAAPSSLEAPLAGLLRESASLADALDIAVELKTLYWRVLDSMNVIELERGQVIHNATPARLLETPGAVPAAEVHALGNPEGLEFLALEIRRPGPTLRAWDNVRFPMRRVEVTEAIAAVNPRATTPEDFIRAPEPVAERPGVSCSIDSAAFRVEHLRPAPGLAIDLPAGRPYSLHVLEGSVGVSWTRPATAIGRASRMLESGDSALVPVGVRDCRLEAEGPAHAIRVTLPEV